MATAPRPRRGLPLIALATCTIALATAPPVHAVPQRPAVAVAAADPGPQPSPGSGPAPVPPAPAPVPTAPAAPGGQPAPGLTPPATSLPAPATGNNLPQPQPSPGVAPSPGPYPGPGVGGWGWLGDLLDIPRLISDALTSFLGMLIDQAEKPVFALLGDTLLATPDVTGNPALVELWTTALGIAAAGYVLFVLVGGVLVMGYETVQTRYALKQIAPRLILGLAAAAASLTVLGKGIELANAASTAILGSARVSGEGIAQQLLGNPLLPANNAVYQLILMLVLLALVFAVLIGYTVRVALIAVLAACAPLALSCHALPMTDGAARLWWRAAAGCLVIQLAQSTVFVVGLKLYFTPGNTVLGLPNPSQLSNLLAGLCLFWVLVKIPGWTARVVFRSTPISMPGLPLPVRMLRSVALAYVLRGAFRGRTGARISRSRLPPGSGGGPARPGPGGPAGGAGPGGAGGPHPLRPPGAPGTPHRPPPPPSGAPTSPSRGSTMPLTPPPSSSSPATVPHPGAARRRQQLALPIPAAKTPARPPRPVQTWLPITAERHARPPAPPPPPPPAPSASAVRGRQMVLRIPAERVRARPPRPVQLRLPLDPPSTLRRER